MREKESEREREKERESMREYEYNGGSVCEGTIRRQEWKRMIVSE
jgi:hypothetical protein